MSAQIAIIIPTWNHWSQTKRCLDSLAELTYPHADILIVDNGSTDETVHQVETNWPAVSLIENGENLGFGKACNVGISHIKPETTHILLLNNDTIVPPDLLENLLATASTLPALGILTPQLRYLDTPDQIWFTGSRRHWLTLEAADLGPVQPRSSLPVDTTIQVDIVFGTAMFIPRSVLDQIGGFDEDFFLYYEDLELCGRVQELGYTLYYTPNTTIYHQVSASTDDGQEMYYYHRARSSVLYFRKVTAGWRIPFIILNRTASALRTSFRLRQQCKYLEIAAYWRGIRDGLLA